MGYFAMLWVSLGVAGAFAMLQAFGYLLGVDLVRDVLVAGLAVVVTLLVLLWILCMVGSEW